MDYKFIDRIKYMLFVSLAILGCFLWPGTAGLVNAESGHFTADSVFVKGISTIGFDSLNETQKKYYKKIDTEMNSFINSVNDLTPNTFYDDKGMSYKRYVIGYKIDFYADTLYDVNAAYRAYDYDHPAYYWISNDVLVDDYNKYFYVLTEPEYASVAERERINALVESGVKEYAALAEAGKDVLDKIKFVHDELIKNADYAHKYVDGKKLTETAKWAHSVHGMFDDGADGKTDSLSHVVCEGYADAFSLIMNYMGISNYYIVGNAGNAGPGGGEGHAWNAVSSDNGKSFMYVDLTWDDRGENGLWYNFFGMPKADFETTHFKYDTTGENDKWLYEIPTDKFTAVYVEPEDDESQENEPSENDKPDSGNESKESVDNDISVEKVTLTPAAKTVKAGKTVILKAEIKPENATDKTVAWSSSNKKVAVVDGKGKVTGIKKGTATITAKSSNGKTGICKITVTGTAKFITKATVTGLKNKTYTGKTQTQSPKVKLGENVLKKGTDYILSYKNNVKAGTAVMTITGKGKYSGTVIKKFKINKAKNTLRVSGRSVSLKTSSLKKSDKRLGVLRLLKITKKGNGRLTYSLSKANKYFKIGKTTGQLTIKRGTPQKAYILTVKVKAAGDNNHKAVTRTVKVRVTV